MRYVGPLEVEFTFQGVGSERVKLRFRARLVGSVIWSHGLARVFRLGLGCFIQDVRKPGGNMNSNGLNTQLIDQVLECASIGWKPIVVLKFQESRHP